MKTKIKKSIILVLVTVFALAVSAQSHDKKQRMTPEERASKQVAMMTKLLDLSEEQQLKIKEINLKHFQQMDNRERKIGKKKMQNWDNIKPQMVARNAEIKQVLTPEQYEKWQENRREMGENRRNISNNHEHEKNKD